MQPLYRTFLVILAFQKLEYLVRKCKKDFVFVLLGFPRNNNVMMAYMVQVHPLESVKRWKLSFSNTDHLHTLHLAFAAQGTTNLKHTDVFIERNLGDMK